MSKIPSGLKYTETHEWAEVLKDGTVRVGITDHAQNLLGDMVFVETPEVGRVLETNEECAVVESVKAASDVYSPVAGEVVEVNEALANAPETINKDPYGQGWIFRLKPSNRAELNKLLAAEAYTRIAQQQTKK